MKLSIDPFIDLGNKPYIIGCDEVGYGSLAGPLVVVGVKAPQDWDLQGLNDSKKLTARQREEMLAKIMPLVISKQIEYHKAERTNEQIDREGLGVMLKDAYVEIFHALYASDAMIITDGNLKFDNLGVDAYDKLSVVKADTWVPTVMAASIIAKVYRDDLMHQLHRQHPVYGWDSNVGYYAKDHLEALKKYGFSPLHRRSYKIKGL